MLCRTACTVLAVFLAVPLALGDGDVITLESLLDEMVDREAVTRAPEPRYRCLQASSYDRGSVEQGVESWWANSDRGHFIRAEEREGRTERVMMDVEGPGTIVRIWSANPSGTLRIYLDGADEPVIQTPMAEALGGEGLIPPPLSAQRSRGWNLYLPIQFARSCKVTSDAGDFYYQINYRLYEAGTDVASTSGKEIAGLMPEILSIGEQLVEEPPVDPSWRASTFEGDVAANSEVVLPLPDARQGGMAIRHLELSLEDAGISEAALRSLVIMMSFDDEQTVWCPVSDFFGSGLGLNPYRGWYRAVQADGRFVCRWVMPFKRSARVHLVNLGEEAIGARLVARTSPYQWDDRSMHFHSAWRFQDPITTRQATGTTDWNYVTIQGTGVYVGDTLTILNPVKAWWGEGDEKIYVDGESFPSHFGTGTEDYYGYAWCSPDLFQAPFHAQPRCDGAEWGHNHGNTTVTRTRSLDAIPFQSSLRLDMEVWHWVQADLAMGATVYYYARPGATDNREPDPESASRPPRRPPPLPGPFKIDGAIEAETMEILSKTKGMTVGPQGGFAEGLWSGERHLWVRAREPGDFVDLLVPSEDDAPKRVLVRATKSFDYGIVRFNVNGEGPSDPIDLYNTEARYVDVTDLIDLGVHEPEDGAFTLRMWVTGANDASEGAKHFFGLDCVVLEAP